MLPYVYIDLSRVGTLKKPNGDLTDIFCVTDSYYVHNIMEQIEIGEYTHMGTQMWGRAIDMKKHI